MPIHGDECLYCYPCACQNRQILSSRISETLSLNQYVAICMEWLHKIRKCFLIRNAHKGYCRGKYPQNKVIIQYLVVWKEIFVIQNLGTCLLLSAKDALFIDYLPTYIIGILCREILTNTHNNLAQLDRRKVAFFASRVISPVVEEQALRWAKACCATDRVVISGFQSPLEKNPSLNSC